MVSFSEAEEMGLADGHLREVSEDERKDISFLVREEYISFFTDPNSEYRIEIDLLDDQPEYVANWKYPEIMWEFRSDVLKAAERLNGFSNRPSGIWTNMREQYFCGRSYVKPEEMIFFLDQFDNKQIVEFLYHCVCYEERFCTGAYACSAEEGLIGRLLVRLRQIPLEIEPFAVNG